MAFWSTGVTVVLKACPANTGVLATCACNELGAGAICAWQLCATRRARARATGHRRNRGGHEVGAIRCSLVHSDAPEHKTTRWLGSGWRGSVADEVRRTGC